MNRSPFVYLLLFALPWRATAQFIDPGFEQSGASPWLMTHPLWTAIVPSDAPYGGSTLMGIRAQSQNFPATAYFYQALPVAAAGDQIQVRFSCRPDPGEGAPPVVANAMLFLLSINAGVPTIVGDFQVTAPMAWTMQDITITVPALPGGSTFGLGFGGVCFQGGDCYMRYDNAHISISGTGAKLNAKAWLDGCYVPGLGLMRDDLRAAGFIPTTEANGILTTWQQFPTGETTTPAVLAVTGNNAIVDWVRVELRMGSPEYGIPQAMRNALIQRDGDIVDVDGVSPVTFPVKGGNYYVHVAHRNHLGVLGTDAVTLTSTPVTFDARSPSTNLYTHVGAESGPPRKTVGATRTLWAGNTWRSLLLSKDILYVGSNNDRDLILTTIGGSTPTQTTTGYHRADVNLDGVVKYVGENNDRDLILQTIGGSVPTAVRYEQVPGP